MENSLDEALVKEFPLLYRDRYKSPQTTCMHWGFECRSGWYNLVRELSAKLEKQILQLKKTTTDPELLPAASQVKEKFGTLRFYMTHETEEMSDAIDKAEAKSERICEECGKDGKLGSNGGWLRVRCKDHWPEGSKTSFDETI